MRGNGSSAEIWTTVSTVVLSCLVGASNLVAKELMVQPGSDLVVVATGGTFEQAMREHFYDPFSKATGVRVNPVAATVSEQWTKVKAMYAAGNVEWDIVSTYPYDLVSQRELLYDLGDCKSLPNVVAQGVPGTCARFGILRTIGGGVIAYSTKAFARDRAPRSWADFWDVKRFPGPRALPNAGSPWWVLSAALMADGVAPERLFPLDVDRAFRKLDEIKPHVKVWWRTGDQSQQMIRDGDVVMAMMWSGRALSLKNDGVPLDVEWNQAIKDVAFWGVLKKAKNVNAALAFLNYFMDRPEAHLAFSRKIVYDTANRRALELLPEPERPARATFERNWRNMVEIDDAWVGANRAAVLERWNAWLAQ